MEVSATGFVAIAIAGFGIIIGLFYLVSTQLRRFSLKVKGDVIDRAGIARKMKEIEEMIKVDSAMARKVAVIEADKLLDYALKELMFTGNSMGDRLQLAAAKHKRLRKVWPAHQLRNKLVHDHNPRLTRTQAVTAIDRFKTALKDLGAV